MPLYIEVNARELRNVIRMVRQWVFIFGIVLGITSIGFHVTPRDTNGRLLILTPGIAEIVGYQQHVTDWTSTMTDSEEKMKALLDNKNDDIYTQDLNFQSIDQNVNKIASEADQTSVPEALTGLRDSIVKAIEAHQQAISAISQWLGDPSPDAYNNALNKIDSAKRILGQIDSNQWVILR